MIVMTKRALVLSGGGARGAYQLGVWKALREIGWDFQIVTGASIGALNSAMIAMGDYDKLEQLWLNMSPKNVIKTEESDPLKVYLQMIKALPRGGSDTTPLYNLAKITINEQLIRASSIEMGISTVEIPSLKLLQLPIYAIPDGKLVDFLVASATVFPFFKAKNIDDKLYADGGYGDNMPINLAIEMGADEIIAVQIFASQKRKLIKDVPLTIIVPSRYLGQFLIFDKSLVRQNIIYGYNDALKYLNYREGEYFTFNHGELSLRSNELQKRLTNFKTIIFIKKESFIQEAYSTLASFLINIKFKSKFNKKYKKPIMSLIAIVESAGKIFEVDDLRSYTLDDFNSIIKQTAQKIMLDNVTLMTKDYGEADLLIKKDKKLLSVYLYYKIRENLKNKTTNNLLITKLITDIEVARAALYLTVINHE
jgi:NTE family protein